MSIEKNKVDKNTFMDAIQSICVRSEKSGDGPLGDSYFDLGYVNKIKSRTNQYIVGRRGTGKTHLFRYFCDLINSQYEPDCGRSVAVFVDMRRSKSVPVDERGEVLSIFNGFLTALSAELKVLSESVFMNNDVPQHREPHGVQVLMRSTELIAQIGSMAVQGGDYVRKGGGIDISIEREDSALVSAKGGIGGDLSHGLTMSASAEMTGAKGRRSLEKESIRAEIAPVFHGFVGLVKELLELNGVDLLYVMVDEWSDISSDIQPEVSELFKIYFSAENIFSFKFAALPRALRFSSQASSVDGASSRIIGMEVTADVFKAVDLDEDLVFYRNPKASRLHMKKIALNHMKSHFMGIGASWDDSGYDAFVPDDVSERLVKFSHGNPRDYLLMLQDSCSRWGKMESQSRLQAADVEEAAKQMGEQRIELIKSLKSGAVGLYDHIIKEVLHERHAGVFMVKSTQSSEPGLLDLFYHKVVHVCDNNYSSPSDSGARFSVFSIDYCVIYKHLKSPNYRHILNIAEQLELFEDAGEDDWVSRLLELAHPDKRRARSIVLNVLAGVGLNLLICHHCKKSIDPQNGSYQKHGYCHHCGEKPC